MFIQHLAVVPLTAINLRQLRLAGMPSIICDAVMHISSLGDITSGELHPVQSSYKLIELLIEAVPKRGIQQLALLKHRLMYSQCLPCTLKGRYLPCALIGDDSCTLRIGMPKLREMMSAYEDHATCHLSRKATISQEIAYSYTVRH